MSYTVTKPSPDPLLDLAVSVHQEWLPGHAFRSGELNSEAARLLRKEGFSSPLSQVGLYLARRDRDFFNICNAYHISE